MLFLLPSTHSRRPPLSDLLSRRASLSSSSVSSLMSAVVHDLRSVHQALSSSPLLALSMCAVIHDLRCLMLQSTMHYQVFPSSCSLDLHNGRCCFRLRSCPLNDFHRAASVFLIHLVLLTTTIKSFHHAAPVFLMFQHYDTASRGSLFREASIGLFQRILILPALLVLCTSSSHDRLKDKICIVLLSLLRLY